MTKTAAIRQATDESSLRYQGGQYILSYYAPTWSAWTETQPMPWPMARQTLSDHRVARALVLLGVPDVDAEYYAYACCGGAVRERVNRALDMIRTREPRLLEAA